MTPAASTEALRREAACQQCQALMDGGLSFNDSAEQAGIPAGTLHRWLKRWRAGGFEAIVPAQAGNSGVKSVRAAWVGQLGEAAVQEVERKVAAMTLDVDPTIDGSRRPLSDGLAWRYIARQPETPAPIRDYFAAGRRSKHTIAESIRQSTRPGPLLAAKHRGPRAFGLAGPYQARTNDILPGDIFSSDDTTPIWAWWVPWPRSEKYPHGVKLLQGQFLPVIDVASQHILCYALIARESSSYRAADIWRLMGRVHGLVGLPRLGWQKERGSWEATIIDGAKLEREDEQEPTHSQRVGGLRMLPTKLLAYHIDKLGEEKAAQWRTLQTFTSYLPKSKSVEGIFHRLQRFEGTLWGSLGRSQQRRPFERTKKIYEACRAGKADPRLHFLSGTELMHRLNACIEANEQEKMEGEVFRGRPPETWTVGLREHGELLDEPSEGRWLMCGDWSLVTVSRGYARVRRPDEVTGFTVSYLYEHPDFLGRLDGRQVLVYFNADAFEQPANILLPGRHTGAQAEWIGEARYVDKRGAFLDSDISGYELRKRQAGIVTTLYSDLAASIPSRQVPAEIASRRREAGIAMETRHPGGDFSKFERPRQTAPEPWDEDADLARVRQMEEAARERGEIFVT
jgi:hypothetical protein